MWLGAAAGAACLLAWSAAPSGAAEAKVWRYGIINAQSDAGILMMVGQHDFAKKQGLEIKFFQFKNAVTEIKALIAGDLDAFEGDPAGSIVAAARGAPVKIIGCEWPGLPHVMMAQDDIRSTKDLVGKTVAISAPGGLPDLLSRAIFEKEGVPVSGIKFANLGGGPDRYRALVARLAAAAVVSDEYVPVGAKHGLKLLVSGSKALPNYMRLCTMTSDSVLSSKRDETVHFLTAQMTALRYALGHRSEALALTREIKHEKADDPRPEYVFDQAVKDKAVDPTMAIPEKKLAFMQDLLVKTKKVKKPIAVAKMVDPGPREAAMKLAGK
jgi:NitT/TauT family transport system substrate-binding protein